jgi:hypothetical protein
MRRKRVYADYLRDIAHYAAKAQEFVGELDYAQFADDEKKAWPFFTPSRSSERPPLICPTQSSNAILTFPGRTL